MAAILVVDNEDVVVRVITASLELVGHFVTKAKSSAEAFQRADEINCIDLLIVNHQIGPDLGREIAERLLLTHPTMKVMHVSGWPRKHLESTSSFTPGAAFLAKPFTIKQVQTAVDALLATQLALPATDG